MTTDSAVAFEAVHEACRARIVRYLARFVGEHEADDLAQEVFLRVARGLPAFRAEARLSTWIYRIARNAAVDRLRRRTLDPPTAGAGDETGDSGPCDRGGAADPVAGALIRTEMNSCIRRLVDALPEKERAVLLLGEIGELRDREVAAALGVTVGAAKIRLHRARTRLRETMERRCELYRDRNSTLSCDEKPRG